MPASKVLLATGASSAAAVTAAQTIVTTQHALGYLLVRAEIISATNILLHFVDRGAADIATMATPVLFNATGANTNAAATAAANQLATQEAAGRFLRQALPLSTTSFLLVFDKVNA